MNILAIDGGGMRGAIPAHILERLEEITEKPTARMFGLIAGTSTGALIGGALAAGIAASEVRALFYERGPSIFKRRWRTYFGLRGARYDVANLRSAIAGVVGDRKLGDCVVPFAACALRLGTSEGRIFRSWHDPHKDLLLADVLAASAAAPTYFDPVAVGGSLHIDGGLAANCPARVALDCALARHDNRTAPLRMVSLATGPSHYSRPSGSGAIHWASTIVDTCIEASMSAAIYSTRLHLGERFFRIEPSLEHASRRMDDASDENLGALWEAGASAAAEWSGRIAEWL